MDHRRFPLGARHFSTDVATSFLVWAPRARLVEVVLDDGARVVPLDRLPDGHHGALVRDVVPGDRYRYRLHRDDDDTVDRADPCSRWQPDGLHGPSAVDDPAFAWTDDAWCAPPLHDQVLYELHVGTFTPDGTFDAIVEHLDDLAALGVTTLELMPVAQPPGDRNWGYDGVLLYAVQEAYGGPAGLRRLVDAAHARGLAVVLDVVHNHLGPEGNHLADFGPYFTDEVATPWGAAVNLDGPDSDPVRRFVVDNAVRWITEFHLDGLRLDAVHALHDQSAVHVLEELAAAVHDAADEQGRRAIVVSESDLQDPRLVRPRSIGGHELDGQWLDDVHHAVHVAVTGEQDGYHADYDGLADLARALRDRFAIAGRWSQFRRRTVGRPARDVPHHRFVVCTQNHDQVGNRQVGERLHTLVGTEAAKAAAGAVLLSPFTPMLFMGQEYADPAPFQYFVSHTEQAVIDGTREGRAREFAYLEQDAGRATPDPQDEATFRRSRLDRRLRSAPAHAAVEECHRALLTARREIAAIASPMAGEPLPRLHGPGIAWSREGPDGSRVLVVVNPADTTLGVTLDGEHTGDWLLLLDTADEAFGGPGDTASPTGGRVDVGPCRTLLFVHRATTEA